MIIVTNIDVLKLDKSKMKDGGYTSKAGKDIVTKDLSLILIPASKGKSHYIVKQGTAKDDDTEMPIIGSANEFGRGAKAPMSGNHNSSNSAGASAPSEEEPF
jgi:hypothetical protein